MAIQLNDIIVEKGNRGNSDFALDLNGATVPNISSEVPVYINFDTVLPPIGKATIFKKDGVIMANIEITAPGVSGKYYPAIRAGFETCDFKAKRKLVTKFLIQGISLCNTPNSDPTIDPIYVL